MTQKKKTSSTTTNSAATWAQPAIDNSLSALGAANTQSQANANAVQPYLMQAMQSVGSGTPDYLQASNNQLKNTIEGSGIGANQYASQLANNPYLSGITQAGAATNPYTSQLASGQSDYIDQLLKVTSTDNPFIQQMGQQIGDQTGSQLASSFGASGRLGGGLSSLLGAQGVGNALSNFYGTQFNNQQQLNATALTNAANYQQNGLNAAAGLAAGDQNRMLSAQQAAGQLSQSGSQAAASIRDAELARQQQAVLSAGSQYQGNLAGISPLLSLASTSTLLPLQGASAYSSGVTQATSPYGTQQNKSTETTGGLGSLIGPALGLAGALTGGGSGLSGLLGGAGGGIASGIPSFMGAGTSPISMGAIPQLNFGGI